jgi:hypothetical protein
MTKSYLRNLNKKEEEFPKAVLQGQSEPVVRFCKSGLSRAGKVFLKVCLIHLWFRWHQLWMAPRVKSVFVPRPSNPPYSVHPKRKRGKF